MVWVVSVVDLRNPFWIQSQGILNSKNLNLIFTGIKQVQLARSKTVTTAWSWRRHSHEPTTVDLQWPYYAPTVALQWTYSGSTVDLQWPYCGPIWTYSGPTVHLQWPYCGPTLCMDAIVLLLTLLGGCVVFGFSGVNRS